MGCASSKPDVPDAPDAPVNQQSKACPACANDIDRPDDDDYMICGCEGRPAFPTYNKAWSSGGCGHHFRWNTLEPLGCGKPGAPANERQVQFKQIKDFQGSLRNFIKATAQPESSTFKSCPACGLYMYNICAGDTMMCGTGAVSSSDAGSGGAYDKALARGGCGHVFKWSSLEPISTGEPGAPENDRQVKFVDAAPSRCPGYWKNQGSRFVPVDDSHLPALDEILRLTYIAKSTQDRLCPDGRHPRTPGGCACVQPYSADELATMPGIRGLPTAYRVLQAVRNEDPQAWLKYIKKRDEIRGRRKDESLSRFSPPLLTDRIVGTCPELFQDLDSNCNEVYLMHGTPMTSALEILDYHFELNLAGVASGRTMYGNGIYMCESSTKADEYAKDKPSTSLEGVFALLICRATMGKFLYATKPDSEAEAQVLNGTYDSTLGDRAKSAGTFREFVVYNGEQVYPEYLVVYHRVYAGDEPCEIEERLKLKLDWLLPGDLY